MNRSGLNLFANGEEGAKGVIHRLGVREVVHDIRVKVATFVPCWSKLAYLPRTAVGLAAVSEVSEFFIEFSLGWSSEPGTDDTDTTVCFIMSRTVPASGRPKLERVMKRLFRRGDIPSAASVLSLELKT